MTHVCKNYIPPGCFIRLRSQNDLLQFQVEDLREKINEKKSEMEEPLKKVKSLRNEVRVRILLFLVFLNFYAFEA